MAYDFTAASSQHLTTASTPITAFPLTLACWAKLSVDVGGRVFVALQDSGATSRVAMSFNGVTSPKRSVQGALFSSSNVFSGVCWSDASVNLNEWYHAAFTISAGNITTAFFNGAAGANTAANAAQPSGIDAIYIGCTESSGTKAGFHDGALAEVGIWNVALTTAEIASLAKGMTCDKVRPQSLVFYAPLVRDLIDAKGGLTITNNNTATVANHPRVYA
jgi:hypothetical protein